MLVSFLTFSKLARILEWILGMDSMSGSIRDSEPTSPTSPGSPDHNAVRQGATSPVTLTQALNTLSVDPPNWPTALRSGVFMDSEALITVEICLVSGNDPIHIGNIQVWPTFVL